MNDEIKIIKIILRPIAIIMLWVGIFSYITKTPLYEWQYSSIKYPEDTTWATIEQQTTTWENITWTIIDIPRDPRTYLDYLIQYGSWWIDYISIAPTNQPAINSKAWSENTARMHDYLYKNRIKFDIPSLDRQWYIMFVTSQPVSNISNIFLWVDGSTIWRLDKKQSLLVENQNEFLYKLDVISLIGNDDYHFPEDLSWKKSIYINAVVLENNNKIEKIILFFR